MRNIFAAVALMLASVAANAQLGQVVTQPAGCNPQTNAQQYEYIVSWILPPGSQVVEHRLYYEDIRTGGFYNFAEVNGVGAAGPVPDNGVPYNYQRRIVSDIEYIDNQGNNKFGFKAGPWYVAFDCRCSIGGIDAIDPIQGIVQEMLLRQAQ